jgi:hypothetical protein
MTPEYLDLVPHRATGLNADILKSAAYCDSVRVSSI